MDMNRRNFIGGAIAATLMGGCAQERVGGLPNGKIRAALLHLGMNMWGGYAAPTETRDPKLEYTRDVCPTERPVWDAAIAEMHKRGYNMLFVDLGGGVAFPSHPEITVRGSWSAQELSDEVKRLRDLGIVAVPKLNFSTCHDAWLGPYERMVSTPKYYEVVKDLLDDADEIFGHPAFIHIGMDEEDYEHQRNFPSVVIRQGELWWHDLNFYFDCLERLGARPVMFGGGTARRCGEEFFRRMPKAVVQNFGMYGSGHTLAGLQEKYRKDPSSLNEMYLKNFGLFRQFSDHGIEILSCASNWKYYGATTTKTGADFPRNRESIAWLHDHIAREVDDRMFLGGLYIPWQPLSETCSQYTLEGIDQLADAMDAHGWKAES